MSSSLTSPTKPIDARQLGLPNVAFVGKAGAGKTTGAELLVQLGYRRLSIATPLKQIAVQLWGKGADTDRDKLQRLGVSVRAIEPDTWVNLAIRDLSPTEDFVGAINLELGRYDKPVVIDDCRFENEWYALKAEGFVIVRVYAGPTRRVDRLKANGKYQNDAQLEHESETAVDHLKPDYVVENNASTDLFGDSLIEVILKERRRR